MCFKNPEIEQFGYVKDKPSKLLKRQGKVSDKWLRVRRQWFVDNQAESYTCYICGRFLWPADVTLDHIKSRSSHPELRFEMSNLAPACWKCNTEKGSRSLENYKKSLA